MDEGHLLELSEKLLVIAGMMMEDLSADMVRGGRAAADVKMDASQLLKASNDMHVIAQCASLLIERADLEL